MSFTEKNRIYVSCTLLADPKHVFDLIYDIERFPTFMPNVTEVRVILDEGDRKIVEWDMLIDDAPLNWTEEVRYERDCLTVKFTALDGAFSQFDGFWRMWSGVTGTELEISVLYNLGLPEIEDIIGPILGERLRQNLKAMLDSIEAQVNLP